MPRRKMDDNFPRLSGKCFGKRLKQIRIEKNISISSLADKVGVLDTYIPQLERGDKLPSFDTLIFIANALDVTVDELVCDYVNADKITVANNISKKTEGLDPTQRRYVEEIIDKLVEYMSEGQ